MSGSARSAERPARRILVVGAGIGGLTAALALSRRGFQVDVAERAETLSEIGAGIQLSANAGRVLADLGLMPAIAAAAVEPSAIEVRSGLSGGLLTSLSGQALRQRYGFPYWVIHRADLQTVLREAVERDAGIRLHLGVEVAGFSETADGSSIRADAPALVSETFAAVIAADGVRSVLRSFISGAATARPANRTAWRALMPVDAVRGLIPVDAVCAWLGPRVHMVSYPVSRGTAVNIVAVIEEHSEHSGWGMAADFAALAPHFASWSPRVRAAMSAASAWTTFPLFRVEATGAWSSGRVALLGDAAHAMLPFLAQGAAMAIEDAAVLAARLAATTDVRPALKLYEAERKGRVAKVAAAAARTGERYHLAGPMAMARDLALRAAGKRLIFGEVDWIYRWQPSAG